MAFFDKYPSAIFIRKNSFSFYINGEEKRLDFPEDTISNGDIVSAEKYEKLIADFVITEKIFKQNFLMVLSGEIIFEKTISSLDIKILDEKFAEFLDIIPMDSEKLVKKSINIEDNIHLVAVNKNLFEKAIETLEALNFEIMAVVPITLYSEDDDFGIELIKKIHDDKTLLHNANFLGNSFMEAREGGNKKNLAIKIGLILFIFVLGVIIIELYFRFSFLQSKKSSAPTVKTTETIESSKLADLKTASPSAILTKDEIGVSILNGTGIAGQAGKIKDLLISLGFSTIETGNTEREDVKDTIVEFTPQITESLQEEVLILLKENFENTVTRIKEASAGAGIIITTGNPKAEGQ